MKKIFLLGLLLFLIPFGCEKREENSLDTSKLKKIEQPHLTKEQRKVFPMRYESSTLEEGLRALPFKINIPNKLPFKFDPIDSLLIDDIDHNGEKLGVHYGLTHFGKSTLFVVDVSIYNYKPELEFDQEYDEPEQIVELKDGVKGIYTGKSTLGVSYKLDHTNEIDNLIENTLIFTKDGMYYELTYVANVDTSEKIKQYVNYIANQML